LPVDVETPKGIGIGQSLNSLSGTEISSKSRAVCGTIAAAMAPEIVTNAIVAAISAGAVAGTKDTAKSAIADAYDGLKSLIKKKFGYDSHAADAIDMLEAKPESDGRKQTLAEELRAVDPTGCRLNGREHRAIWAPRFGH
jgi:hypothetical protein